MKNSPLVYLSKRKLINCFKQPKNYIAFIIIFVLVCLVYFNSVEIKISLTKYVFKNIYTVILLALTIVFPFIIRPNKNKINDVDAFYLVPKPIADKNVLLYTMVKTIKNTLLGFILIYTFIAPFISNIFKLTTIQNFISFLGLLLYINILITLQFILSSSNKFKIINKAIIIIMVSLLLIAILFLIYDRKSLVLFISSSAIDFIPIVGWINGLVSSALFNNYIGLLYSVPILIFICIMLFWFKNTRFKINNLLEQNQNQKQIHTNYTSTIKGKRGSALFVKQLVEFKRKNKFYFINALIVFNILFTILIAYALTQSTINDFYKLPNLFVYIMSAFIHCLTTGIIGFSDSWAEEIQKPFIHLIPLHFIKKYFWISLSALSKSILSIILLITLGLILGIDIAIIIGVVITYISYVLLFVSSVLLFKFIFNNKESIQTSNNIGIFEMLISFTKTILNVILSAPSLWISYVMYSFNINLLIILLTVILINVILFLILGIITRSVLE